MDRMDQVRTRRGWRHATAFVGHSACSVMAGRDAAAGVPLCALPGLRGVPGHQELAMGAIASGGVRVINRRLVRPLGIADAAVEQVTAEETRELERREREYRGGRAPAPVRGRTVILVDDGLATGSTMVAAIEALRLQDPARIVVAAGVGAAQTCAALSG